MAGSPPCFQLRCSNPTFGWAVLGARGPLGVQGEACDALAEASFPLLFPLLSPSSASFVDPIPCLFLSPPPWWIPHNPPRDLPPRRLLFLFFLLPSSYL